MVNFLDKQNILYDRKYGFRNGKSAEDAVYDFINNINNNSQKNLKSLAVFLDLSKAFDIFRTSFYSIVWKEQASHTAFLSYWKKIFTFLFRIHWLISYTDKIKADQNYCATIFAFFAVLVTDFSRTIRSNPF